MLCEVSGRATLSTRRCMQAQSQEGREPLLSSKHVLRSSICPEGIFPFTSSILTQRGSIKEAFGFVGLACYTLQDLCPGVHGISC